MPVQSVIPPFPMFFDTDGSPLENGYIYLGQSNLDPINNQISAYWDEALSNPVSQPIRTLAGRPARDGTPSRLYVNEDDFSILVRDKKGAAVYSSLTDSFRLPSAAVGGTSSADNVTYDLSTTGSVERTVASKLSEWISVFDFMTSAQIIDVKSNAGTIDVTAAVQAALDAAAALAGGQTVYCPAGTYKISSTLLFNGHSLRLLGNQRGAFPGSAGIHTTDVGGTRFNLEMSGVGVDFNEYTYCTVDSITFRSTSCETGIYIGWVSHNFQVINCCIDGQNGSGVPTGFSTAGISTERSYYGTIRDCDIFRCLGRGIYMFEESNGNYVVENSVRQCLSAIEISDQGDSPSNSDANTVANNCFESARSSASSEGASHLIYINGADNNAIVGNRLEMVEAGDSKYHIAVLFTSTDNSFDTQNNQLIANNCIGPAKALLIGDGAGGAGSGKVNNTFVCGGKGAGAFVISTDCQYTKLICAPGAYFNSTFADSGYGSDINMDANNGTVYQKPFNSNQVGIQRTIGSLGIVDDFGDKFYRIDFGSVEDVFRFYTLNIDSKDIPVIWFKGWRYYVDTATGKLYYHGLDPTTISDGTLVSEQIPDP